MRLDYKGLEIGCSEGVYKPSEDSFLLADAVGKEIRAGDSVLELGAGTGIVSLVAAGKAAAVTAVDVNPEAVELARKNAALNYIKNFLVKKSDLFSNVKDRYDLIIFNAPYLPTGPEENVKGEINRAWDGGPDGRRVINRFLREAKRYLKKDGRLLLLESSLSSYEKSVRFLEKRDFKVSIVARKKLEWEELVVMKAEMSS